MTITLPTPAHLRAELAAKGWYLLDPSLKRTEHWCHDDPKCDIILHDDVHVPIIGDGHDFFKVLEFAALLGIGQQEGVMIPLEDVIDLANYTAFAASKMGTASAKELAERTTRRYLAALSATQPQVNTDD